MDMILLILRLVHIVGGIFWVGAAMMMTFFLFPAMMGAGPAAGPVQAGLQKRGFMTVLPIVALLTMVSGLAMIWRLSGGDIGVYARSSAGSAFTTAGGLAILGFVVGMVVARPNAMRAGGIMREMATTADAATREQLAALLPAVQRRSVVGSTVSTLLLMAAAAGMALARYL
jgi:hypothetical protein